MAFRITGLAPEPFRPLFALSDAELAARHIRPCVADTKPGFPCRVSLVDAEPGERVLLLNYTHQPAATPYRASHAIYVREAAAAAYDGLDEVPDALRVRPLSLRAFGPSGMMVDADLVDGREIEALIDRLLADPAVEYVQAHFARRGCYAARIERA